MTDFGKKLLFKFGWTEGRGLGREENGIPQALKPKLKFNSTGLGFNRADEFCFSWWDHAFNKTVENLNVTGTKDKIDMNKSVKPRKEFVLSTKKHENHDKKSKLVYGCFIKSKQSLNQEKLKSESSESDSEEEFKDMSSTLSDDQLFQICGGLTAHKGARHGLTMSGKLKRLEIQEAEFLQKLRSPVSQVTKKILKDSTPAHKIKRKKSVQFSGEVKLKIFSYRNFSRDNDSDHCIKLNSEQLFGDESDYDSDINTSFNDFCTQYEEEDIYSNIAEDEQKSRSKVFSEEMLEAIVHELGNDENILPNENCLTNDDYPIKKKHKRKEVNRECLNSNKINVRSTSIEPDTSVDSESFEIRNKKVKRKKKNACENDSAKLLETTADYSSIVEYNTAEKFKPKMSKKHKKVMESSEAVSKFEDCVPCQKKKERSISVGDESTSTRVLIDTANEHISKSENRKKVKKIGAEDHSSEATIATDDIGKKRKKKRKLREVDFNNESVVSSDEKNATKTQSLICEEHITSDVIKIHKKKKKSKNSSSEDIENVDEMMQQSLEDIVHVKKKKKKKRNLEEINCSVSDIEIAPKKKKRKKCIEE